MVRFVLPLLVVLSGVAYGIIPLVERLTLSWFVRDLDIRSKLIASTLEESLIEEWSQGGSRRLSSLFQRAIQDERLFALGFCNEKNELQVKTVTFPAAFRCGDQESLDAKSSELLEKDFGLFHFASHEILSDHRRIGRLVLVHDLSFAKRRSSETRKYIFYFFSALAVLVSLITVVIAQLSIRGVVNGMRGLLRGEGFLSFEQRAGHPELLPLAKDLRALVRDLERDRRIKDESQIAWTPNAIKKILNQDLKGDEVMIVSNREPYIHTYKGSKIEVQLPASGLVTALEPIMRACSGTWIAHGGGSADKEVVDKNSHFKAPPEDPSYQIRRVWLTKEQEQGYYYGFSNEGLWPLCHIAHTRPTFRTSDWEHYIEVNRIFADAVIEEAKTEDPVILVQDYHFALLPKMVRERLPKATIITFWHIPWPNSESFGICPWREEILSGLLGSSVIGFHTQFHCNNFIDSLDRFLEARIDRDSANVYHGGKMTAIRSYPISIEWPPRWIGGQAPITECRSHIRGQLGLSRNHMIGLGVDRLDYTKGIIERFLAVERLLELFPQWVGRFSLVQIAAPSRSSIAQYQHLDAEVRALAERINAKFRSGSYLPIVLKIEHHEPASVFQHYRAADVCLVTSLHDGMNLVAKEFVAAHEDELGVLILSQFTGAARELPEALIVNPYDIDQCANALHEALSMSHTEQRIRMKSMRGLVQEFNIYRWAGRMLMDAAVLRNRERLKGRLSERDAPGVGG